MNVNYNFYGLSILSILFSIVLIIIFKKKLFGLLDPLSIFLITRISALISGIFIFDNLNILNYNILIISAIILIIGLFYSNKDIKKYLPKHAVCWVDIQFYKKILLIIVSLKIILYSYIWSDIPLLGNMGSNTYIEFNEKYKIFSTLLMGIGSIDLIIVSFLLPQVKNKKLLYGLALLCILFSVMNGKKSSVINIITSVALAEYIRVSYTSFNKYYFLKIKNIFIALLIGIIWALYIYKNTENIEFELYEFNINTAIRILDHIFYQFSMQYDLFTSGALNEFFDLYKVNKFLYPFHTILSPLGIRAFEFSIGPAINEFLTGVQSGNGVNPTFILEGTVLFGVYLLPLYTLLLCLIIYWFKNNIFSGKSKLFYLNIFYFYPILFSIYTDLLFLFKSIVVYIILYIIIFFTIIKISKHDKSTFKN